MLVILFSSIIICVFVFIKVVYELLDNKIIFFINFDILVIII